MKDFHLRIEDATRDMIDMQAAKERRTGARVVEEAIALYVYLWAGYEREKGGTAKLGALVDRAMEQIKRSVK